VDNRSFLLDMKILARTVGQTLAGIFGSHGINQPGQATAAPFTGSGGGGGAHAEAAATGAATEAEA
jgi:hypothetical protein